MASLGKNPFQPGFGLTPAYMGHRPNLEKALLDALESVRDEAPGARGILLYGPRGNGKTVLLNWLQRQAEGEDGGAPVPSVRFSSRDAGSTARMSAAVRRGRHRLEGLRAALEDSGISIRFDLPLLSVRVERDMGDPAIAFESWLSESDGPLLLTMDEAHEADSTALGNLLDAVQTAGYSRPLALVLAGTPGILDTLRQSRASFWSRCERLPVGLLPETAARDVLEVPFRKSGAEADTDAVAALARAAENYPYFLQLYGRTAWDLLAARGKNHLRATHVEAVLRAAREQRQLYYGDRYDEFDASELLPLARHIALMSRSAPDGQIKDMRLNAELARLSGDPPDRRKMKTFLIAKGYIWRETGERIWTPGIPSLMDYMIEQTEPGPSAS